MGTQPGDPHADIDMGVAVHEIPGMQTQTINLIAPISQAQEGTQRHLAHPGRGAPFRRFQPEAIISLGSWQDGSLIEALIVRLLIKGQSIHSGGNELGILGLRQGIDLDSQTVEIPFEEQGTVPDIGNRALPPRFAGQNEEMAEPERRNGPCLPFPLL
jgi:hypothetical protein